MLYKIPEFIQLCRVAGLTVASSEIIDLLVSIKLLGWEKEKVFLAMSVTLVKEEKDIIALEKLFKFFFFCSAQSDSRSSLNSDEILANPPCWEPGEFVESFLRLKNTIKEEMGKLQGKCSGSAGKGGGGSGCGLSAKPAASPADKLILLLKSGNADTLRAFIKEQIDHLKILNEHKLPEFLSVLQELKVAMGLAEAQYRMSKQEEMCKVMEVLCWQENEKLLNRMMRFELEEALLKKWPEESLKQIAKNVNTKEMDFNLLSEEQVDEIRNTLRRMARRLATRNGYRYARARRGLIDLRRTASRAIQTGGVPLLLYCRQRVPDKPEIVVIYDLSGSVALFSEFILQLVYTLHKSIHGKVCSFAFVDCIAETTSFIKGENLNREIRNVIEKTNISKTNFSNYGQVWKQFVQQFINVITPKTIVLVLGDARNNWYPAYEEYFADISAACKKLIWLNPSPMEKWNTEDSIISIYGPYCDHVFECRNLQQLESSVLRIF